MAALPENWEWDYDGSRWFYRYKPTGLIQFSFPRPGDEFPEFVDDTTGPPDLAPEEKLVSQQQVKRRSTLGDSTSGPPTAAGRRDRAASNAVSDAADDGGSPFWLQPDGLMYMGPGAYNDISPLQEEEEEGHRGMVDSNQDQEKDTGDKAASASATVENANTTASADVATDTTATAATAAIEAAPNGSTGGTGSAEKPPTARSQISPVASTETTPLVITSHPATTTSELDGAGIIEANEHVPVSEVVAAPPHEVPLLDSRQVPYNPIGFVAELASEFTAQCDEEINPAPVELPSNEIMLDTSEPEVYANAFHLAAVELPSDEAPIRHNVTSSAEQKSLAPMSSRAEEEQERQQKAYQAVQQLLNRPYRAVRQNSMPLSSTTLSQAPNLAAGPTPGKYQPYNPAKHALLGPVAVNRYSTVETRNHHPAGDRKTHSLMGPALSQFRPSDLPQPPKRSLDSSTNGGQTTAPSSGAAPLNISGPITKESSGGLVHFPSVLQPARGRPIIRSQSPPQSQGASPARPYQAYKPYRDLQQDIEETVQLLSQTEYGQGTSTPPGTSNAGRPQISRTSTLPSHLPVLPYMGVRPHLPASVASEPAMGNLQSHQAPPGEPASSIALGEYAAPISTSSSDVPQPLSLSRKSPPPPGNSPPMTTSSFSPPATAENRAPGLSTMARARPEAHEHHENSGTVSNTEETRHSNPTAASSEQSHALLEQTVSSGFTVMAASPSPPIPQAAASPQPSSKPDTTTQPVPTTSFAVEISDVPPVLGNAQVTSMPSGPVPHSGSDSKPLLAGMQTVVAARDHHSTPSTSEVFLQQTSQSIPSQPSLAASDNAQGASYLVSNYQPAVHVDQQPPPRPDKILPTDETVEPQAASGHYYSMSVSSLASGLTVHAVTPPPLSVTPRQPSPRTPSPVSRASSPPAQRTNVPQSIPSVTPPALAVTNFQQYPTSTGSMMVPTGSTASGHALPSGHHPLGSHPVHVSQLSPPGHTSNGSQGPPMAVSPPFVGQQGAMRPAQSTPIPGQRASQPGAPQPFPAAGQAQIPPQPVGQMQPVPARGQTIPGDPVQAPHNIPPRAFSQPAFSQSGPHPGLPGTAPPQMQMMFAPSAVPMGMQPQQPYFQSGKQQPLPPHMMRPSKMPGGQYVMQHPQPAQPVKEEKSWFGKLWKSDTVKKPNNAANPTGRLQKGTRSQPPLILPPHLHPTQPVPHPHFAPPGTQMPPHMMYPNQQAQRPPPGMQQQRQQQQQQQGTPQKPQQQQHHHQQQQQQQPLTWQTNGHQTQPPQIRAPTHNPNQPVMPPPHVLQNIQQQEQRLNQQQQGQGHRLSMGSGPGQGQGQGQSQGQGYGQGHGGQNVVATPPRAAGNQGKRGSTGNDNGNTMAAHAGGTEYDGSGYDGSGWGDEHGEYK